MGEYRVVLQEEGTTLGTVNEDFAIESLAGDIFVLGTHSWKIKWVRGGEVVVEDAHGQPPSIPFWLGEAPARTQEFSQAVSDFRKTVSEKLDVKALVASDFSNLEAILQLKNLNPAPFATACQWMQEKTRVQDPWALIQAAHFIGAEKAALGLVPSCEKIVFERFFDEIGGMHLVIHSPYGTLGTQRGRLPS